MNFVSDSPKKWFRVTNSSKERHMPWNWKEILKLKILFVTNFDLISFSSPVLRFYKFWSSITSICLLLILAEAKYNFPQFSSLDAYKSLRSKRRFQCQNFKRRICGFAVYNLIFLTIIRKIFFCFVLGFRTKSLQYCSIKNWEIFDASVLAFNWRSTKYTRQMSTLVNLLFMLFV